MRLKKVKNAYEYIIESKNFIKSPNENKNSWNKIFSNNNPIELEIGMGKGDFIIKKALLNPNINYIGLEKFDSVLFYAIKKLDELNLSNIKLINEDAINLKEIFGKEISKIYLNFSDPWPKKRHTKRRLTFKTFLDIYNSIFKEDVNIEMKTDNDNLFDYSLESFVEYGYEIREIDRNKIDEYQTEYEKKFISKGKNINYVSIYSKLNNNK